MSVCLCRHPSVGLSVRPSVMHAPIHLSVCLSVCLFICLSVLTFVRLSLSSSFLSPVCTSYNKTFKSQLSVKLATKFRHALGPRPLGLCHKSFHHPSLILAGKAWSLPLEWSSVWSLENVSCSVLKFLFTAKNVEKSCPGPNVIKLFLSLIFEFS